MKKTLAAGGLAAVLALGMIGCANDAEAPAPGDGGDSAELTAITVGALPQTDTAPVWLGAELGFFEEEGLDITVDATQGGAAAVAGIVSGEYDFSFGNYPAIFVARDQGLDLRYVSNGVSTAGDPDISAVVVREDSDIQSPADLVGKRVGVHNISSLGDLTIRGVVDADGGDQSEIEFVEVVFPEAEAALENNQVDAVWLMEPLLHSTLTRDFRSISFHFSEFHPNYELSGYFATGETIENNPELVEAFQRAIHKSIEYAQENPDEVRRIVTTYMTLDADQVADMVLPTFRTDIDMDAMNQIADAMVEYGMVTERPDLEAVLP